MILWAPLPKSREAILRSETLGRHSHPKCRVLPLHCQEAPNSPPYRTLSHKDDSNYTKYCPNHGGTHGCKTNYLLKLYLNFKPLQARPISCWMFKSPVRVDLCLTVVLGRSAVRGVTHGFARSTSTPGPVENICSTSKYTILFQEEKFWFWRQFEDGLHNNRQMRTLTANLAKLIPNKSFHGRSGACNKCYLGPGWWNPRW